MSKYLNKNHSVSSLFFFITVAGTSLIILLLLLFLFQTENPDYEILLFLALLTALTVFLISSLMIFRNDKPAPTYLNEQLTTSETDPDFKVIRDLQNEKKYFASMLSHDLRSPLSSILLLSSYLKSKDGDSQNNQYIELIEQSARKELDLMSNLLSLMRADSYRTELFEELRLKDVANEILQSEESRLTKKHLTIDLAIPADLTVFADPQIFKVILKNIIIQAICYSEENKTIEILSNEGLDRTIIELVIISEELQNEAGEDLFNSDRLFSKHRKNKFPECIDLYFCRQAIRNYNGTIHVQVEQNLSCRFIMSLQRLPGKTIV